MEERSAAGTDWRIAVAAALAAGFIRALRATVRLRHHGDAELRRRERDGERFILAFWHRHLLLMRYAYHGPRISVLVSRHRDGELIARTVAHLGVDASRGSTTRGGVAGLRALLRRAEQGYDLAFTPDGPRGPAGSVQPGILLAAQATGWPIQPVALAASRCWRLASWDRFIVPQPASRVHLAYGEPLWVPRGCDRRAAGESLKRRLDAAEAAAARLAAGGVASEEERGCGA